MIKYNLKCVCGSVFESWFASSNSYDSLKRRKLVKCIHCDSDLVEKSIMAPNLKSKSNKFTIKNNQEKKIRKQHNWRNNSNYFILCLWSFNNWNTSY